jgi:GDP-L-fucose synthase
VSHKNGANNGGRSQWAGRRVLVTGAGGFVGRNLVPLLEGSGCELVTPSRRDYDLLEQDQVRRLLADASPDVVFHLAGLIGGIGANKARPAEFCYQNLVMGTTMLHESWRSGVSKYVTLMGGCSYPGKAPSPIDETTLWTGYPQPESAPYSLAKAMGTLQAQSYRRQYGFDAIVLVPGNLYGPFDNFDLNNSHVIPALIRKFHEAKLSGKPEIVAWGSGNPVRDFVYVEDACRVIVKAAETYSREELINISSGVRTRIRDLTETVADLVGYEGEVRWDATKPDGQMEKVFDVTRMRDWLGCECPTPLREGLRKTIEWFRANYATARLGEPCPA